MLAQDKNRIIILVASAFALFVGLTAFVLFGNLNQKGDNNSTNNTANDYSNYCWNNVISSGDTFFWKDGCKSSSPKEARFCTQMLIELSSTEKSEYSKWINTGKIIPNSCKLE